MISLENILSSNMEMLNNQEAELLRALNLVKKAKALFGSSKGKGRTKAASGKKRGRPAAGKKNLKPSVKAISIKRAGKGNKKGKSAAKRVGHLENIMAVLKDKNKPMGSGDLIKTLFQKQKADKNIKHFRLLIYPVLTKAYKSGTLKLKNGMISLGK